MSSSSDRSSTVVVVAGGEPPDARLARVVPSDAMVVAADSGLDHAHALGLHADLVVGDCDSVSPDGLATAEAAGATIEAHPTDKDATDLELALDAAVAAAPRRIVLIGGHGGRADHHLANLCLLASPSLAAVEVTAWMGSARIAVVRRRREVQGPVGSLVSLVPLLGDAVGVTTKGLRWPLVDEDLPGASTRGVSNEVAAADAGVTIRSGVLLAIQPHALEERCP